MQMTASQNPIGKPTRMNTLPLARIWVGAPTVLFVTDVEIFTVGFPFYCFLGINVCFGVSHSGSKNRPSLLGNTSQLYSVTVDTVHKRPVVPMVLPLVWFSEPVTVTIGCEAAGGQ